MSSPEPGWNPDPAGRHEYRYWDGSTWTDDVSDNGVTATDPLAGAGGPPYPGETAPTAPFEPTQAYGQPGPIDAGYGQPGAPGTYPPAGPGGYPPGRPRRARWARWLRPVRHRWRAAAVHAPQVGPPHRPDHRPRGRGRGGHRRHRGDRPGRRRRRHGDRRHHDDHAGRHHRHDGRSRRGDDDHGCRGSRRRDAGRVRPRRRRLRHRRHVARGRGARGHHHRLQPAARHRGVPLVHAHRRLAARRGRHPGHRRGAVPARRSRRSWASTTTTRCTRSPSSAPRPTRGMRATASCCA